jgi:hypothetical protein
MTNKAAAPNKSLMTIAVMGNVMQKIIMQPITNPTMPI